MTWTEWIRFLNYTSYLWAKELIQSSSTVGRSTKARDFVTDFVVIKFVVVRYFLSSLNVPLCEENNLHNHHIDIVSQKEESHVGSPTALDAN